MNAVHSLKTRFNVECGALYLKFNLIPYSNVGLARPPTESLAIMMNKFSRQQRMSPELLSEIRELAPAIKYQVESNLVRPEQFNKARQSGLRSNLTQQQYLETCRLLESKTLNDLIAILYDLGIREQFPPDIRDIVSERDRSNDLLIKQKICNYINNYLATLQSRKELLSETYTGTPTQWILPE